MTRTTIFSGGGDYSDPWHPFAATTECLRALLEEEGITATVVDTVTGLEHRGDAAALEHRGDAAALLVLNAGNGEQPNPLDARLLAHIDAHLAARRPMLAVHASASLFPELPQWERLLGGRWVRGVSWHPPLDEAHVELAPHAITTGLDEVRVVDERYSELRLARDAEVLAWHTEDGVRHPLAWAHTAHGARIVYVALGHDPRSFDSPTRRALLAREVRWLLAR